MGPMIPPPGGPAPPPAGNYDWGMAAQQWLKSKEMYEQWQQQQYQAHIQIMANAHRAAMASSIDLTVVRNPPPPPPIPPPASPVVVPKQENKTLTTMPVLPPVIETTTKNTNDPTTPESLKSSTNMNVDMSNSGDVADMQQQQQQQLFQTSNAAGLAKSKFKSRFSNSSLLKAAVNAIAAKDLAAENAGNIGNNGNNGYSGYDVDMASINNNNNRIKPLFPGYESSKVILKLLLFYFIYKKRLLFFYGINRILWKY